MVGWGISFSPRKPRVKKTRPPRATLCPLTWVDPDGLPFGGVGCRPDGRAFSLAGPMFCPSLQAPSQTLSFFFCLMGMVFRIGQDVCRLL